MFDPRTDPPTDGLVLRVVLALVAAVPLWLLLAGRRNDKRPPGPLTLPIIGTIFTPDSKGPWLDFSRWRTHYGDIISLCVLGTDVVVLNTHKASVDLLEKRGSIYSGRPVFTVVGELMGLNQSLALMQNNSEWRACRRLTHMALNPMAVKQYHELQEHVSAKLVAEILNDPSNFYDIVRLSAARIVLSVTYGLSADIIDSEYIEHAEATMKMIGESMMPGAYICDLIPFLKHLPRWVPFQRKASFGKYLIETMVTTPYDKVKREMMNGMAAPSLTQELVNRSREEKTEKENEDRIKWTAGAMFSAGGETTFGTVLVFMIAMVLHPEKQARAQQEIDSVIGVERLPRISDKDALPYTNALIKEVMRWHPIVPLGLARRVDEDDIYEGYRIPKGATIIPNVWQIAHEPDTKYPPEEFIPERFLDPECSVIDPSNWAFGFGRRICPGKSMAEASVFIFITTMLSTLKISPSAKPLLPEYGSDLVSIPKRFECTLSPRSAAKENMVREVAV